MPHITTAMESSMRRSVGDIIAHSLARSITGEVSNVKNTFSSWDNCMAQSYCKWPVIVVIVIVGLILLSIITCIARCLCCGYSCCCACFSFLKCCDCCGDSCAGKKDKPSKYKDDPYQASPFSHAPARGYQAPAPMMGGGLGGKPEPPQYAQFEVGKSGLAVDPNAGLSEDALPPMPSWDSAAKKHVLTEEEKNAVELGELDPTTGQKIPLMSGAAATGLSVPPSPSHDSGRGQSPFGARPAPGPNSNGYMGVAGDPYAQNTAAFAGSGRAYNNGSPAPEAYRGNGRGGYGGQGRGYDNGRGRGYGQTSPNEYAQDQYDDGFSGAPVAGGHNRPQPGREYSNNRPFPPQPSRQYSSDSARPLNPGSGYSDNGPGYPTDNFQPAPRGPPRERRMASPGPGGIASPQLQNNSGFDFGGQTEQYPRQQRRPSPPQQQESYGDYAGSTAAPTYASRSPPPQDQGYPGYRPYQSNNANGRGTPNGGRGAREPQRPWDPVQQ